MSVTSALTVQIDGSDQPYIEVPWLADEHFIRVTFIANSWSGTGGVRIQVRQPDGHLRQGPEMPVESLGTVVSAVTKLLLHTAAHGVRGPAA
jgi:hypothetical protein